MKNSLHMKLLLSSTALAVMALPHLAFSSGLHLENIADMSQAYKTAKICFLPDCQDDEVMNGDIEIDINKDTKWCEDKGYYLTCPSLTAPTDKFCRNDPAYKECTKEAWCKTNKFNITTCPKPQYLNGQCDNLEPYYKTCKDDKPRACQEIGYTKTCPSGQKLFSDQRCSWDTSFGKCCTPKACPANTSITGTYGNSGNTDGCGYICKYTCDRSCPSSYPYAYDPTGCSDRSWNSCAGIYCYNYKTCCTPSCTNNSGYCSQGTYMQNNGCNGYCTKCMNIQTGSIYHSDGSIDTSAIPGKTPIAIVADPSNRLLIALHDCTSPTSFSSASYSCNNYQTENTSRGSWYIPDLQTLKKIYNNKNILNDAFRKAGGDTFSSWDSSKVYWSSTTRSSDNSPYGIYFSSGTNNPIDPSHNHFSRAVKRF